MTIGGVSSDNRRSVQREPAGVQVQQYCEVLARALGDPAVTSVSLPERGGRVGVSVGLARSERTGRSSAPVKWVWRSARRLPSPPAIPTLPGL